MKPYELTNIRDFTYRLTIYGDHVLPLYQTIKKLLPSAHYDSETNSLFFSCEQIISLKEQLSKKQTYSSCIKMIDDLSKQILTINRLGYGFYGFDIQDILTIDGTFVICSSTCLLPLNETDTLLFIVPPHIPYLANPELYKLTSLPSEIHVTCIYYSLGVLTVLYLLQTFLLVGNEVKTQEEIEIILNPIYNTKLYWFIKRCLSDERVLLFI